jgi:hypothetical protein
LPKKGASYDAREATMVGLRATAFKPAAGSTATPFGCTAAWPSADYGRISIAVERRRLFS